MTQADVLQTLVTWTPYLAEGFLWNVAVSIAAMAIGTPAGLVLAGGRQSRHRYRQRAATLLTTAARNAPTFVMLFYLALVLPPEVTVGQATVVFPGWLKASLALAIAVAGFVSDTGQVALGHWRRGEHAEALLFIPAWTTYFIIIVMASSTASVIGVPEIVHRANTIIGATGQRELMVWVYLYAMLWFLVFCGLASLIMRAIRKRLENRSHRHAQAGQMVEDLDQ